LLFRGLTVRGAHDSLETSDWNEAVILDTFFRLHGSGRFPLAGLGTNRFAPEQCAAAYAFARERRNDSMGIFFDWNHLS
jgi:hypothetical protein